MSEKSIDIYYLHPKAICPPGRAWIDGYSNGFNQIVTLRPHESFDPARTLSGIFLTDSGGRAYAVASDMPDGHIPEDLTGAEAMAVLRALAERFPEHVVVAADEVRSRLGEPDVKAWRHPDDVAAIELAWFDLAFWKDDIAALRLLREMVPRERRTSLIMAARRRDEEETGEPCLLGEID